MREINKRFLLSLMSIIDIQLSLFVFGLSCGLSDYMDLRICLSKQTGKPTGPKKIASQNIIWIGLKTRRFFFLPWCYVVLYVHISCYCWLANYLLCSWRTFFGWMHVQVRNRKLFCAYRCKMAPLSHSMKNSAIMILILHCLWWRLDYALHIWNVTSALSLSCCFGGPRLPSALQKITAQVRQSHVFHL